MNAMFILKKPVPKEQAFFYLLRSSELTPSAPRVSQINFFIHICNGTIFHDYELTTQHT
jgi:hypothetical protein